MTYHIDVQNACKNPLPISKDHLKSWVIRALTTHRTSAELTLRVVEPSEMKELNHVYRQQNKTTNVLAFPANLPPDVKLDYPFLGDVIICAAVLQQESVEQNTSLMNHWAHIVIHGVLHLLGYDHINEEDATIMQALEIQLLADFDIDNPYEDSAIE